MVRERPSGLVRIDAVRMNRPCRDLLGDVAFQFVRRGLFDTLCGVINNRWREVAPRCELSDEGDS